MDPQQHQQQQLAAYGEFVSLSLQKTARRKQLKAEDAQTKLKENTLKSCVDRDMTANNRSVLEVKLEASNESCFVVRSKKRKVASLTLPFIKNGYLKFNELQKKYVSEEEAQQFIDFLKKQSEQHAKEETNIKCSQTRPPEAYF